MTQPTHTHRQHGGRFAEVERLEGGGASEGKGLVVYHDLSRDVRSFTDPSDWEQNWRPIESDDCPVCLGAKHDQIKGNRDKPCGGCYGLGKVRSDGETPADRWELATIAARIIQRQQLELAQLRPIANDAEVQALLHQRQQDAIGRSEQVWREGKGHGHGGQRHTGD